MSNNYYSSSFIIRKEEGLKGRIGLSDLEIESLIKDSPDESQALILNYRHYCNEALRGEMSKPMDPIAGALLFWGKHWAEKIGEDMVRKIYQEQIEYMNLFPSKKQLEEQLVSLMGIDYSFHVREKRGDYYIVSMIDEDTNEHLRFLIANKQIWYFLDDATGKVETEELRQIVEEEKDAIIKLVSTVKKRM